MREPCRVIAENQLICSVAITPEDASLLRVDRKIDRRSPERTAVFAVFAERLRAPCSPSQLFAADLATSKRLLIFLSLPLYRLVLNSSSCVVVVVGRGPVRET